MRMQFMKSKAVIRKSALEMTPRNYPGPQNPLKTPRGTLTTRPFPGMLNDDFIDASMKRLSDDVSRCTETSCDRLVLFQ